MLTKAQGIRQVPNTKGESGLAVINSSNSACYKEAKAVCE